MTGSCRALGVRCAPDDETPRNIKRDETLSLQSILHLIYLLSILHLHPAKNAILCLSPDHHWGAPLWSFSSKSSREALDCRLLRTESHEFQNDPAGQQQEGRAKDDPAPDEVIALSRRDVLLGKQSDDEGGRNGFGD